VKTAGSDESLLEEQLRELLPVDPDAAKWNRELVQKGMSEMGREALQQAKENMGAGHRADILSFADIIDFDEGRIP
jgi:hypothetical protein